MVAFTLYRGDASIFVCEFILREEVVLLPSMFYSFVSTSLIMFMIVFFFHCFFRELIPCEAGKMQ